MLRNRIFILYKKSIIELIIQYIFTIYCKDHSIHPEDYIRNNGKAQSENKFSKFRQQ